jgi:hypothetical protein
MSGKLTAIQYDSSKLPLSPHVLEYTAFDASEAIVFRADVVEPELLRDSFNEFVVRVPEGQQVDLLNVPQGEYAMLVSIEGNAERPIVIFDFQDVNSGEVYQGVRMDQAQFISDFALVTYGMEPSESEVIEMPWSIEYMKDVLGADIRADKEFWSKLAGDLDVVLMPINIQMEMASQGKPYKPVKVDKSQAVPEIRH